MRHNSREYAGVPLDNPIFRYEEQKAAAGRSTVFDFSDAKTRMEKAASEAVQAKYEFVFRRRFPISTAGSRCNSENGRF